jgi:hypothetical protein
MLKLNRNSIELVAKRNFSLFSLTNARKPPREEYERNIYQTRAKTFDPFNKYSIIISIIILTRFVFLRINVSLK